MQEKAVEFVKKGGEIYTKPSSLMKSVVGARTARAPYSSVPRMR